MRFAFRSLAVLFAAVLGTSAALAQAYPSKQPIKAVVPFAAGSATDQIGRAFAAKMQETLGQTIVVDNKPGVNGMLGADAVAKSPRRRLHHPDRHQQHQRGAQELDEKAALRPGHGVRSGGLHGFRAADRRRQQRRACQDPARAGRHGQEQSPAM